MWGSGYKPVNGGMSVSMQLRLLLRNDESVTVMMLFCGCPLARSGTWRKHFADQQRGCGTLCQLH